MTETWRPIPNAPGYEASDFGRIRGVARTVIRRDGRPHRCAQHIKKLTSDGHHLYVNVGGKKRFVHRLVLEAFVGMRPEAHEACHNNGIGTDNRLSNLRWDTRSANVRDQVSHGVHNCASKTHCKRGHAFSEHGATHRNGSRFCVTCARLTSRARYLRHRDAAPEAPKRESSNVTPIHRFENNVRTLPQRRWGA